MMEKGFLKPILRSHQTVFTFKELLLLWGGIDVDNAKARVNYYVKTGGLYHIRRGIYAKDSNYDRWEAATRIYTPAYISFETVLGQAGITFQSYSQIFVASYQSLIRVVDGQKIVFRRLNDKILTNLEGIENRGNYYIASAERAFLDVIFLTNDYHFDNLLPLDWQKVKDILHIYERTKRMSERLTDYKRSMEEA